MKKIIIIIIIINFIDYALSPVPYTLKLSLINPSFY